MTNFHVECDGLNECIGLFLLLSCRLLYLSIICQVRIKGDTRWTVTRSMDRQPLDPKLPLEDDLILASHANHEVCQMMLVISDGGENVGIRSTVVSYLD